MSYYKHIQGKDVGKIGDDSYTTPMEEFEKLKDFVPEGLTIIDPFCYDGTSRDYIKKVFKPKKVIHSCGKDYFNGVHKLPLFDMVVTNPPFSQKREVLKWLVGLDKPFVCLLPTSVITTQWFLETVKDKSEVGIIMPVGRIRFEKDGAPMKHNAFYTCLWVTRYVKGNGIKNIRLSFV